jgi:predicted nuclease of predicted toxin-antitoxin system
MKLVVDMNLSPLWVEALRQVGHDAVHWSQVGDARASDREIMAWARARDRVVLTHDLDFTAVLALTRAYGPSVIQIRTQDVMPDVIGAIVLRVLRDHEQAIEQGAIVSIDHAAARVRILPIR